MKDIKRRDWAAKGYVLLSVASLVSILCTGCRSNDQRKEENRFFTSGSREADQRASQRMAKDDQLAGPEKGEKKAAEKDSAIVPEKKTLYERLGGEQGLSAIVDDFVQRVVQDPRVNWKREGVDRGGFFSLPRDKKNTVMWQGTPQELAVLKKHFVQFLSLATGGPARYDGEEIKQGHAEMEISNPEFDAAIGDLKASLDRLQIADREQKELLAIIESTRPQIVTKR